MDQYKIGAFLKELRQERGITQERLAEELSVSNRSVSRWETGRNLPDIDILLELRRYYGVDIGELLDGGRREAETGETVEMLADYSTELRRRITRNFHFLFIGGLAAALLGTALGFTGNYDNFWGGLCQGIVTGMMILGVIMTSRRADRLIAFKRKHLHMD
ncbi:MAG: helix-turn-helix transcriptional regulator [Oscillospiraceae bacterium]|nr:helix-turn-helix transcriptional regulator [Oscillospiraceae bacterium]